MVGFYFRKFTSDIGAMADWMNLNCQTTINGRSWKWIAHPAAPPGYERWGILLPDYETLVAFKLKFPVQTYDEFSNSEAPEDFAFHNFDLGIR